MVEDRLVTSSASVLEASSGAGTRESRASTDGAVPPDTVPLDRAQVEALISREYAGLRLLIAARAGDPQLGADLLNDAICITWDKWLAGNIRHSGQIVGYTFQVAMNLLRNHRRAMAERPDKRADPAVLEALPLAEPQGEELQAEVVRKVKEVIREMGSARDRAVLVRFYLDEQEREDICRDMQITAAQFAKMLHRARNRLRSLLEKAGVRSADLFCFLGVL
jgi:RNA polymerase sigma-70 factor, ECF subfamily